MASALFSSDQPPGLSIKRRSERFSWLTPLTRKKPVMISSPSKEASIAASRENGMKPRSKASRIFFSVGSSVLLSLSGSSAI